jgi:hypothetical protein
MPQWHRIVVIDDDEGFAFGQHFKCREDGSVPHPWHERWNIDNDVTLVAVTAHVDISPAGYFNGQASLIARCADFRNRTGRIIRRLCQANQVRSSRSAQSFETNLRS